MQESYESTRRTLHVLISSTCCCHGDPDSIRRGKVLCCAALCVACCFPRAAAVVMQASGPADAPSFTTIALSAPSIQAVGIGIGITIGIHPGRLHRHRHRHLMQTGPWLRRPRSFSVFRQTPLVAAAAMMPMMMHLDGSRLRVAPAASLPLRMASLTNKRDRRLPSPRLWLTTQGGWTAQSSNEAAGTSNGNAELTHLKCQHSARCMTRD